ncbi:PKD domain-containing protein [candidate division GN15 bacterium]|nr:PKD domain-containing protein [candidate division GN15 bacterium]
MIRLKVILLTLTVAAAVAIWAPGCDDLVTEVNEVTIAGHPNAEFAIYTDSGYKDSGCAPLTVRFRDLSNGPIDQWLWDFGDGDTSSDTNPIHTYDSSGTYTVRLTVYNNQVSDVGEDTETKGRFILVGSTVDSFAVQTQACVGEELTFEPLDMADVSSFSWRFGDGTGSSDSVPVHAYDTVGVYSCTLTVTGGCGSKTLAYDSLIFVRDCPQVAFAAFDSAGCVPFDVTFIDATLSDAGIVSRQWRLDDAVFSDKQNPVHTYTEPGTYTVKLTVTDANDATVSDSIVDFITVYDTGGVAIDTLTPSFACKSDFQQFQVVFRGDSLGDVDSLKWFFGDGTFYVDKQNPPGNAVHAYIDPDKYTVILQAYGPCYSVVDGEDTIPYVADTAVNLVALYDTLPGPPSFTIDPDTASGDTTTLFTFAHTFDTATYPVQTWEWSFGDDSTLTEEGPVEHKYAEPGTYEITLTISTPCNSSAIVDTVEVVDTP